MIQKRQKLIDQSTTNQITVEMTLWILVAVIALVLRLASLDAAPLSIHEAREAMLAWRAVTGQGMPKADYSPFLFAANALLFSLCGASDSLARFWPALCGSALTLTPFLLRRYIGRVGALAAGLYMVFSPTLLFASRQLDGTVVTALAGMMFVGGLVRFSETKRQSWLTLSAGGLALSMTSSSSTFGLLLALGLAWVSLAWIWPDRGIRWLQALFNSHLNQGLVVFLVTGLLISTAMGWNLAGLGAAGDLLPSWVARFNLSSDATTVSPIVILVVYELLALIFGLGGLVWAVWRGHRFGVLLGVWAVVAILLLMLMPDRMLLDIVWGLLPLALLVGIAVEQLVTSLYEHGDWLSEGLHVLIVVLLWGYFYLKLAGYVAYGDATALVLAALLVFVSQGLLAAIFALAIKFEAVLRSVIIGTGIALLALLISAGWGIAYVRPSDPRELLVRDPTAVEVHDLTQTLDNLSWRRTGFPSTLPFVLEAEQDSVLAWYLRDFPSALRVESLAADVAVGEAASVLVTSRTELDVPGDAEYVGQGFALHRTWQPSEITCVWAWPLQCQSVVGWWLFRNTPMPPMTNQQAILWLTENQ